VEVVRVPVATEELVCTAHGATPVTVTGGTPAEADAVDNNEEVGVAVGDAAQGATPVTVSGGAWWGR